MKKIPFVFLLSVLYLMGCEPFKESSSSSTSQVQEQRSSHFEGGLQDVFLEPNLRKGEVLITIDEAPFAGQTEKIAKFLREQGISAVFFLVGDKVGTTVSKDGKSQLRSIKDIVDKKDKVLTHFLRPELLRPIIQNDHYVANHSLSHPLSYGSDSLVEQYTEIRNAHKVIVTALEELGIVRHWKSEFNIIARSRFINWFRPPGGSWSLIPGRGRAIQEKLWNWGGRAAIYEGPIGWTLGRGKEDFRCKEEGETAQECANGYLEQYWEAEDQSGVAIFHGNILDNEKGIADEERFYSFQVIKAFVLGLKKKQQRQGAHSPVGFPDPTIVF